MMNEEFELRMDKVVQAERRITREILELILLAEERKIYLERGCDSLVRWLVARFKFSETSANRRVQAARLLRAAPEAMAKVESGS